MRQQDDNTLSINIKDKCDHSQLALLAELSLANSDRFAMITSKINTHWHTQEDVTEKSLRNILHAEDPFHSFVDTVQWRFLWQ